MTDRNVFDAWESRAAVSGPTREWTEVELWFMGYTGPDDPRVKELELPDYPEATWAEIVTESRRLLSPDEQAKFDAFCRASTEAYELVARAPLGLHAVQVVPPHIWKQLTPLSHTSLEKQAMNRSGGRGSDGFTFEDVVHGNHDLSTLHHRSTPANQLWR